MSRIFRTRRCSFQISSSGFAFSQAEPTPYSKIPRALQNCKCISSTRKILVFLNRKLNQRQFVCSIQKVFETIPYRESLKFYFSLPHLASEPKPNKNWRPPVLGRPKKFFFLLRNRFFLIARKQVLLFSELSTSSERFLSSWLEKTRTTEMFLKL